MEVNYRFRKLMFEVVDNQINGTDTEPALPYVKGKFEQLSKKYGKDKAKEYIAAVLICEMYDVMKNKTVFNDEHYRTEIDKLN